MLQHAAGRDAQWLAYTGATIGGEDARSKGLIDEVVEADRLMSRANEMARQLAAVPAESFRLTKLQLRRIATDDAAAARVWSDPVIHAHIRDYLARTVGRK